MGLRSGKNHGPISQNREYRQHRVRLYYLYLLFGDIGPSFWDVFSGRRSSGVFTWTSKKPTKQWALGLLYSLFLDILPLFWALCRSRKRLHKHPTKHSFWNPPCLEPNNQNVGSCFYVAFGALFVRLPTTSVPKAEGVALHSMTCLRCVWGYRSPYHGSDYGTGPVSYKFPPSRHQYSGELPTRYLVFEWYLRYTWTSKVPKIMAQYPKREYRKCRVHCSGHFGGRGTRILSKRTCKENPRHDPSWDMICGPMLP